LPGGDGPSRFDEEVFSLRSRYLPTFPGEKYVNLSVLIYVHHDRPAAAIGQCDVLGPFVQDRHFARPVMMHPAALETAQAEPVAL